MASSIYYINYNESQIITHLSSTIMINEFVNLFSFINKNKKFLIAEIAFASFFNSGRLPLGHLKDVFITSELFMA